ncbi:MAG: hypothetical protein EZS28_023200 [Streblomastix strix]|uniref:Uncharacterized protein n=1 Tax=Streblomastix strix TaxID=222440 RepID=A0A5J4VFP5_9EUKA|nr:MAG: hypothetical protein EZS28_023200 [Streblomastix strix]
MGSGIDGIMGRIIVVVIQVFKRTGDIYIAVFYEAAVQDDRGLGTDEGLLIEIGKAISIQLNQIHINVPLEFQPQAKQMVHWTNGVFVLEGNYSSKFKDNWESDDPKRDEEDC